MELMLKVLALLRARQKEAATTEAWLPTNQIKSDGVVNHQNRNSWGLSSGYISSYTPQHKNSLSNVFVDYTSTTTTALF
jgi:hypothetical protein